MRMPMKSLPAIVGAVLLAGVAAAQPKDYKPPVKDVPPALDKIAMTDFVCDPSPIPPGTAQVKLTVTVKNLTSGPQSVTINGPKLRILRTLPQSTRGDVLELETTVVNLAPGATQSASQNVNVAPGVREYFARVDVDDTLHEPIVQRANNEKRLRITIPQASGQQAPPPGSAPPKETQLLDYDKAKRSGAQFGISLEGASPCRHREMDVNAPGVEGPGGRPAAGVWLDLYCQGLPSGARANAEAFANFHLKNGWKVKSYDVVAVQKSGGADWNWSRNPVVGTDDPFSKVHLWADANGIIRLCVKIEIEGPAGTNPYQ